MYSSMSLAWQITVAVAVLAAVASVATVVLWLRQTGIHPFRGLGRGCDRSLGVKGEMMKVKTLVALIALSAAVRLFGASMVWNAFEYWHNESSGSALDGFRYDGFDSSCGPGFSSEWSRVHGVNKVTMTQLPYHTLADMYSVWVEAYCGDVLSAEYFNSAKVVATVFSESEYGAASSLTARAGDTVYLAMFGKVSIDYAVELTDYYAWLEFSVGDGNLTLLASAISDTPLIVGGGSVIPEPSGGLLLLLGLAALGLRRRREGDE